LNIVQERNRMIHLLEKLTEDTIPRYTPFQSLNSNSDLADTSNRSEQMKKYISQKRSNQDYCEKEQAKNTEAHSRKRKNSDYRKNEQAKRAVCYRVRR